MTISPGERFDLSRINAMSDDVDEKGKVQLLPRDEKHEDAM
jgi:hypothetical protein